jgi:hypothetical protein
LRENIADRGQPARHGGRWAYNQEDHERYGDDENLCFIMACHLPKLSFSVSPGKSNLNAKGPWLKNLFKFWVLDWISKTNGEKQGATILDNFV